ncbi:MULTISPECIES: glycoside hydrolase family 88 protein [Olivibacter]|uniref:Glycoside hydrolase family 88 protein n=1 Tax=Olivibacter jilunii TaxID=985016 RepID=A0ABW6AWD9_9SPHI|nr:glycoside hydrolase family 88 protein [Olivibacter sp. UJ_SKK_5.1]MDX3913672.1 glycoside hydrolase family 88 protein [Pseudosphingobacterium sp.]
MKNRLNGYMLLFCVTVSVSVAKAQYTLKKDFIEKNLNEAIKQIDYLGSNTPSEKLPRTYEAGKSISSGTGWWTSGFYPGTLLYLYEYSGNEELLNRAKQKLKLLEKEKNNTTTHDLGFMLYCSFGNILRLTGDRSAYKDVLLTGANSLISRFNPVTKTIRSWEGWTYPVIIDNMMNLEFLTQASKISGEKKYQDIAITHANTTMKNHYRNDMSCYHVVDYNPQTGDIVAKKTAQGAFDESAWARGQAWGLYGYTMMYRETKRKEYLQFAKKIATYILNHPNMPDDGVPFWDFNAPDLPASSPYASQYKQYRDASAAAIIASALLELSTYVKNTKAKEYVNAAEKMLVSLSSDSYKAPIGSNGGFILMHSVGSIPHKSEIDVPLTYADYYYVEALLRYRNLLRN